MTFQQVKKGINRLFNFVSGGAGALAYIILHDASPNAGFFLLLLMAIFAAGLTRLAGTFVLWIIGGFAKNEDD